MLELWSDLKNSLKKPQNSLKNNITWAGKLWICLCFTKLRGSLFKKRRDQPKKYIVIKLLCIIIVIMIVHRYLRNHVIVHRYLRNHVIIHRYLRNQIIVHWYLRNHVIVIGKGTVQNNPIVQHWKLWKQVCKGKEEQKSPVREKKRRRDPV